MARNPNQRDPEEKSKTLDTRDSYQVITLPKFQVSPPPPLQVLSKDENFFFPARRREILGGSRADAIAARYSGTGRERKGAAAASIRSQSHRADVARGSNDPPDRPLRRLVRGVHRGLRPCTNSAES